MAHGSALCAGERAGAGVARGFWGRPKLGALRAGCVGVYVGCNTVYCVYAYVCVFSRGFECVPVRGFQMLVYVVCGGVVQTQLA